MSQGQGSFQTNQKPPVQAPPGPPFLLTSADNGLSVDPISGKIVLGQDIGAVGDPAQLISAREIPLHLFPLHILERTQPLADYIFLDPGNSQAHYGANDGTASAIIDLVGQVGAVTGSFAVTDSVGGAQLFLQGNVGSPIAQVNASDAVNGGSLQIQPDAYEIRSGSATRFNYDGLSKRYGWGDLGTTLSGIRVLLDESLDTFEIADSNFTYFHFDFGSSLSGFIKLVNGADDAELFLDAVNGVASLFADNAGFTTIASIDGVNGIWRAFSNINGTFLRMSDVNQQVEAGNDNGGGTVIHYLQLNKVAKTYAIGDIDGADTGTTLTVNDTTEKFVLDNTAHTSIVRINGVDGFTGTVTPVTSITVNGGIVTNVT